MSDTYAPNRKSTRKAKGDGHLRRAEILHAAERIFLAEGYEGATIRKIADEVGVSSTALYMHFRDKEDILLEICQGAFRDLLEINQGIAARPIDPVERVRLCLREYMRFAVDNPNAYRLVFCSGPAMPLAPERAEKLKMGEECFDIFCHLLDGVAAAGRLREPDPKGGGQGAVGRLPRPCGAVHLQAGVRLGVARPADGRDAGEPVRRRGDRLIRRPRQGWLAIE